MLHNRYQQAGGEDAVALAERRLLESHGDSVDWLEADNAEIAGFAGRAKAALSTTYSLGAKRQLAARIAAFRPDVVHVQNFFPLFSPSIYYACREAAIPVVQTLHNYRLICPNAQLLRNGRVCEDCVPKGLPWPSVLHACYRGSRAGTAAVAAMIAIHRGIGTWRNMVDAFIALTEFSRDKMIEGGLSAEKVFVKPNFVSDPGDAEGGRGHYALFVGRLSGEKGIATLLAGWKETQGGVLLKIAGDGPLKRDVVQCAAAARIEYLGAQPRQKILRLMRDAAFLVFPSIWYEGLPMVILEAFSVGLPVIASNLGSVASLVEHGRTGLHFRPGNARDLAEKIEWALGHPREIARMRHEARAEYLAKYTSKRNYEMLMEIYTRVTRKSISPNVAVSHAEFSG